MVNKLIFGFGINDSTNPITIKSQYIKPFYIWHSMLRRCYNFQYKLKIPTYKDCSVCEEWKYYSKFLEWFNVNYIKDYDLDKDI
jgi:hypothetical protein